MKQDNKLKRSELLSFIKKVKPITSKRFNVPYETWIFFDSEYAYAFNGLFFYLEPFVTPKEMALPAPQVEALIAKEKDEDVFLLFGNDTVSIGCGRSQAEFAYPFSSIAEYMKSFYIESAPKSEFTTIPDILPAIDFCFNYVFPLNIEYSNVYVHDGKFMASDGYRIAAANTKSRGIPDTSFSIGTDKVLGNIGSPDLMLDRDSSVSFWISDGLLSIAKNIGSYTAVASYIPNTELLQQEFSFAEEKEWKKAIQSAKKFDDEFKKKDTKVILTINGNTATLKVEGMKARFQQELPLEYSTADFEFIINPAHLLDMVSMGGIVRFGEADYVMCETYNQKLYQWVER